MATPPPTAPSAPYPHSPVPPSNPGPQPFAPKRSWFARHKVLTGLGAVVVIGAVASALGGGHGTSSTAGPHADGTTVASAPATPSDPAQADTAQDSEETTEEAGSEVTFPGMKSGDVVASGGETVTSDDVQITTTALTAGDATLGPTACTSVTIVNNSKNPLDVNAFDFTLQTPTGAIINPTFSGTDNFLQSSTLIAGGTVTGDVCFDQDLTGGGQYVVLYKPTLSFFKDRVAWVNTL
ncbi:MULTISPECIES: DUF4352 domain-containing protein [Actinomyces]|uniref:DUF4352 domain-containing protein n=1 Tax=Actinomyces respiraculi TaxID=2744574 RepID=A0A7T0LKC9_9ACTO|nr:MULTISPECIES: DUF4352 domain-containing protein [Actinomyces]QPL05399.1 DUF4352 domain-containing protein [Actinomyces respiraculi]